MPGGLTPAQVEAALAASLGQLPLSSAPGQRPTAADQPPFEALPTQYQQALEQKESEEAAQIKLRLAQRAAARIARIAEEKAEAEARAQAIEAQAIEQTEARAAALERITPITPEELVKRIGRLTKDLMVMTPIAELNEAVPAKGPKSKLTKLRDLVNRYVKEIGDFTREYMIQFGGLPGGFRESLHRDGFLQSRSTVNLYVKAYVLGLLKDISEELMPTATKIGIRSTLTGFASLFSRDSSNTLALLNEEITKDPRIPQILRRLQAYE